MLQIYLLLGEFSAEPIWHEEQELFMQTATLIINVNKTQLTQFTDDNFTHAIIRIYSQFRI